MILVIQRIQVFPVKRKELSQTIAFLIGSLRRGKGRRRYDFCWSMEDEMEYPLKFG